MNNCGTLILICGLPGAGKTTLAKKMEVERAAIRLNADDWIERLLTHPSDTAARDRLRDPVENLQLDLARSLLAHGVTVILDNGFWAKEERDAYAMVAIELGARVELYYLTVEFEELWRRIELRNASMVSKTFVMTRSEVEVGWGLFQPPTLEEIAFYDAGSLIDPS